nr:hypothetical protein GCM10020093_057480 [Planobispora longispora]
MIFADAAGRAHARRWTNRQSGHSSVRETTAAVLIVAEAMHGSAAADVPDLVAAIADGLGEVWRTSPETAIPTPPRRAWSSRCDGPRGVLGVTARADLGVTARVELSP